MKDKIIRWFDTGDGKIGASPRVMACCIAGITIPDKSFPCDPSDFNRCLMFLAAVPEARNHMDKLKEISITWKSIVENWEAIERSFLNEVGLNWTNGTNASKTYKLMQDSRKY